VAHGLLLRLGVSAMTEDYASTSAHQVNCSGAANFLVDKDGLLRQTALPSSLESGCVEKSQAFTAWVLALVGVFIGVTAPFALVMGIGELRAQKDGRRDPDGNRGWAQAGTMGPWSSKHKSCPHFVRQRTGNSAH
jgi:hypothetical protein